jgi:hypothetical protein
VNLDVGVARALDPRQRPQRAVRKCHGTSQVGDQALHRLADPPRGVGPEGRVHSWLIAAQRTQEADDALLHQLRVFDTGRVPINPGERTYRRHEGLHEPIAGYRIAAGGTGHEPALLRARESGPARHMARRGAAWHEAVVLGVNEGRLHVIHL